MLDGCSVIGTPQSRNKSDDLSENEDVEMTPSQNPVRPKNNHERELPVYEQDLIQEEAEKLAAATDEEMNSNEEIFSTFDKKDSLMPNRRNHQVKEPEIIAIEDDDIEEIPTPTNQPDSDLDRARKKNQNRLNNLARRSKIRHKSSESNSIAKNVIIKQNMNERQTSMLSSDRDVVGSSFRSFRQETQNKQSPVDRPSCIPDRRSFSSNNESERLNIIPRSVSMPDRRNASGYENSTGYCTNISDDDSTSIRTESPSIFTSKSKQISPLKSRKRKRLKDAYDEFDLQIQKHIYEHPILARVTDDNTFIDDFDGVHSSLNETLEEKRAAVEAKFEQEKKLLKIRRDSEIERLESQALDCSVKLFGPSSYLKEIKDLSDKNESDRCDLLAEDDLSDDDLNSKEEASKMRKAEFDVTKNKIKGLLNKFCELNPNREQNGYVNGKRSYPVKVKTEKKSDEEETITISSSEEEDQPVRAGSSLIKSRRKVTVKSKRHEPPKKVQKTQACRLENISRAMDESSEDSNIENRTLEELREKALRSTMSKSNKVQKPSNRIFIKPPSSLKSHIGAMPNRLAPSIPPSVLPYTSHSECDSVFSRLSSESNENANLPELREVSPVYKIDRDSKKGYSKARYMDISATKAFRYEILICDIVEREIILYDMSKKSQIRVNSQTLSQLQEVLGLESARFLESPSACCFIENITGDENRKPTYVKYIAFLAIDGIFVLERNGEDCFEFFCHFKTDSTAVSRSISRDQQRMSNHVGLEYFFDHDLRKHYLVTVHRKRNEMQLFELDAKHECQNRIESNRIIKIDPAFKDKIVRCRFLSKDLDAQYLYLSIMDTDNDKSKSILKISIESGQADGHFGEHGEQIIDDGVQLSGLCEVEKRNQEPFLLAAMNGKQKPGRNMILRVRPEERQYKDQVHRCKIVNAGKEVVKDLRPVKIAQNGKYAFVLSHPYQRSDAKIWVFELPDYC